MTKKSRILELGKMNLIFLSYKESAAEIHNQNYRDMVKKLGFEL